MKLKDLGLLIEEIKKNYEKNYENRDLKLPETFKDEFRRYLTLKKDKVKYLDYTCEITIDKSGNKIFLPNQWFYLSALILEFTNELKNYKDTLGDIFNSGNVFENKKEYDEILKLQKDKTGKDINSKLNNEILRYFKEDTESINFIKSFLTDYKWWHGSKTIDRHDYYVSPVLNILKLVNVTQAYVAEIAYAYVLDESLKKEAKKILKILKESKGNNAEEYLKYDEKVLGSKLKESYDNSNNKVAGIHLFGIEYGKYIENNNLNKKKILEYSTINASYSTEISKGVVLSKLGVKSLEGEKPILHNKIIKSRNRIIYGAPGTGKSYQLSLDSKCFKRYVLEKKQKDEETIEPNYWLGACGENNHLYSEFLEKGVFAIGWEALGDPNRFSSLDELNRELVKTHSWMSTNNQTQNYFSYIKSMKKGDIILARKGISPEIQGYAIVTEPYAYDPSIIKGHPNIVKVKWVKTDTQVLEGYSRKQLTRNTLASANLEMVSILNKKNYFEKSVEISEKIENTVERVTFYDGYTHGQFVGSYKPVPKNDSITYEYIVGPFMRQLVKAYKNHNDNFCLIVEEINRARADKVFGNVFQLLDRDENGKSQYPVSLSEEQILYLQKVLGEDDQEILEILLTDGLYIPANLYIWATMNSADQGVYPLDTAFKRRWSFEHIGLNENEKKMTGLKVRLEKDLEVEWNDFRKEINDRLLSIKVSEDRLLAPFFVKKEEFRDGILDDKVFIDKILVYLFDDVLRHKKKETLFKRDINSFSKLKEELKSSKRIFKDEFYNKFESEEKFKSYSSSEPKVNEVADPKEPYSDGAD